MPKIVDSFSLKHYPVESNVKTIRFRRLKKDFNNEKDKKDVYEVVYYDETMMNQLGKEKYLEFDPSDSSVVFKERGELLARLPAESSQEVYKIATAQSTTSTQSGCTWDWGYTEPFTRGWYFEHANFGGAELGWVQPSIPYTISRWMVSISNLNSSPWWFNDKISSISPRFTYKSIYCAEEDLLKRRFAYTDAIGVWKNSNFGNPMVWLPCIVMNTENNPPTMYGAIANLYGWHWPDFWQTSMNDSISSIRVYISIIEETIGN